MIKKIALLLLAFIVYVVVSQPSHLAEASLAVFDATNSGFQQRKSLGGPCDNDRCLTIYVAPWCGTCKKAHSMIESLVSQLEKEGIKADIIVGMDDSKKLIDYAKKFSSPVFLDTDGVYFDQLHKAKGVPYFAVSNWEGEIVKVVSGATFRVEGMRQRLEL